MDAVYEEINRDLLHFIAKAPSVFHAVNSIRTALSYAGLRKYGKKTRGRLKEAGNMSSQETAPPSWHLPSLKTAAMRSE